MEIKEDNIYYVNVTAIRSFINLRTVYEYINSLSWYRPIAETYKKLLGSASICTSHSYKNLETADKFCSKFCDGETEMTVKVEILSTYQHHKYSRKYYDIAISNPTYKEKFRERMIISGVTKKQLETFINIKY